VDFKEIEQALADKTSELETAKALELKSINERLAQLKQKEEARQREAKDAQRAATAAAVRRRLEQQAAEERLLREEIEKRTLEEQVYAYKQAQLEGDVRTTEELEKAIVEQQHIEELVKKSLDNAQYAIRRTLGNEGEVIMQHPLARFLQKAPE
jgi:hypothetical protein